MKKFLNENGVNKVYVQVKDLKFILENRASSNVRDNIDSIILSENIQFYDENEYVLYDDIEIINYLKNIAFILDVDECSNLSIDEINNKINYLNNQINLLNEKESLKMLYDRLIYSRDSMISLLNSKKNLNVKVLKK